MTEQPNSDLLEQKPFPDLAASLGSRTDRIIQIWTEQVRRLLPRVRGFSREQLIDSLPKIVPETVYTTDRELRYTWIENPHPLFDVKEIIGRRADEFIGVAGAREFVEFKRHVLENGRGDRREVRLEINGKQKVFDITAEPLRDDTGNIIGVTVAAFDITVRVHAEERFRAEQKRIAEEREHLLKSEQAARAESERAGRMKDEFLATLSHELRTPLNAILGWSQLINRGGRDEETLNEGLAAIERNSRVQMQLIEDLLDMSGIISGKVRLDVQTIEPASFINAAIETVMPGAAAKGVRLEKVLDTLAGPVSADPARLQQVVWNLLSNAIKFTPKSGKIQVLLERVNSHIEINVADTGQGMTPEFLPHVFERFRQADASTTRTHGGLGLGLSIVKQLVELHGGTIRAKSPGEGQGSTFTVSLPLTVVHRDKTEAKRVHPKAPQSKPMEFECMNLAGLKVLVVDDEADARLLIRRVLEACDLQVVTAQSAEVGLEVLERERPDVLVCDIGMPDVDGYEFLRRVRALGAARGGKVPAIALTAFARSEDRTRALRAGYLVHVSKPVEPSELVATIASVAGRTGDHA